MSTIESLKERFSKIEETFQFHKHDLDFKRRQASDIEKYIDQKSQTKTAYQKADKVFEELIRRLNDSSITMVESLVTEGLSTIFEKPFEFKIRVEQKRGVLAYFPVLLEQGEELNIMDSRGGGIVAVTSILMRIVTILVSNPPLKRLLILDESLAQLSKEYTDKAAEFFKKLGKSFGFTIIMVTHDYGFVDHADKVYEVTKIGDEAEVAERARD